ncbi:MAG: SpaA isopeptide-forming pilin-related protein [Bacillota bacterium]|uniref:LPXTG cell wall anchor domain-containing protein n=1 Tax=unclassified Virgibacillus TaxID=2620237 RepID=UPI000EF4DF15|nr:MULTISPECIES: LPXTG cell wall anchor domain-containing protein [unclassified Virgibacillus]MCC2249392.1 LPXTG cell wall anchor domain-containing protein [Virgibacillus sp. AGTR]MDY7043007.1 SpaA isopeptide-forming pilin-related protein [Virgibacillus sp. M23]QRZ18816.1 LPXTG cell wall anchor domain-containing protein [Virgibacillus sp. AGTR]
MNVLKSSKFITITVILTLILSLLYTTIFLIDTASANDSPRYKTFFSLDRGNITYDDGRPPSIGYVDRITENNPLGGAILGTRFKVDENGVIVYCLNWDLDSPLLEKDGGNEYKKTSERLTKEEYTAMVYAYGNDQDITNDYTINGKKLTEDQRYYVSQVALYIVSHDMNSKNITIDSLIKHTRGEIDHEISEELYKIIEKHVDYIENNLLDVPAEEDLHIKLEGQANKLVQNGTYFESDVLQLKVNNQNAKVVFTKKNLYNAYFVDLEGNTVTDDYILDGNAFKIRLNAKDIEEKGKIELAFKATTDIENVYKYEPRYQDSDKRGQGVDGEKLQRITWMETDTKEANVSVSINYDIVKGDLVIHKTDVGTGESLEGATFEIKDEKGNIVSTMTTNKQGLAITEGLTFGKYTYQEIEAPAGYVLDENIYEIAVLENGEVTAEITNDIIRGNFELNKVDEKTNEPLEGATFEIKDVEGNHISTVTTNKQGLAMVEGLPFGKYTYQEVEAPEGYEIDQTVYEFAIEETGKTVNVTMKNNAKKASTNEQQSKEAPKKLPKTGDKTNTINYMLGSLFLAAAVILARLVRKKENNESN